MISNTATLTSYANTYFLACLIMLMFMFILWAIYVMFHEKIARKYSKNFRQFNKQTFFVRRTITDHMNFEMLVKIREQSSKLLPYRPISVRLADGSEYGNNQEQIDGLKN